MARLSGSASADINAPLQTVWAVLEDVLAGPEWQSGLERMVAVERDAAGRPTLVDTDNDLRVIVVKARIRFHYDPPTLLAWTQEAGDMKSASGACELVDLGSGRTRATYRLDADLGRVLGLAVRGPVAAAARAVFVNRRAEELRRRVEGG